jgi:hypothetical protein
LRREEMSKYICDVCGYEDTADTVKKYHVTPQEITEEAAIKRVKIIKLCPACRKDLDKWYLNNISHTTYDSRNKRFRGKTPAEMVKEYEIAYQSFTRHKKEKQEIT